MNQFPDIQGKITPELQRLYSDVAKWIEYHNLSRNGLGGGFVAAEDWEFRHGPVAWAGDGLVAVLRTGWQNDLARIFDASYGGSSHLMKDFEEEVLAPLKMSMGWIRQPSLVGVFKVPSTKSSAVSEAVSGALDRGPRRERLRSERSPRIYRVRKNPCHGRSRRRG